ncbi:MAG: FtsQ-type POTRA domain-containing protein, partial [Acidobacteriaceae bacterium]
FAGCVLLALGGAAALVWEAQHFLDHDPRFVIASSTSIRTVGNSQLTRADLLSVFGSDIGRNLFFVPLRERRAELEQIPWVEHATVMRVLPDQLRVSVSERTPIAFVEIHGRIELADAAGVILDMSPQDLAAKHYSFPVVLGINPGDPLSMRGARMQLYQRFLRDLDSGGEKISSRLSEVDLSDPEDVKATVPENGTDLLLYFGQEDFLARWQNYEAHVAQWRAQYPNLASVDLRYEREVVLKMANAPSAPSAAAAAAKPAPPATHARRDTGQKRAAKRKLATQNRRGRKHTVRGAQ